MIELLTTVEMGEADRLTIAGGVAGIVLMENAGRAVADRVRRAIRPAPASPWSPGRATTAATASSRRASWPSAATGCGCSWSATPAGSRRRGAGRARWQGRSEAAAPAALPPAEAVVDALFGAGLDRPVEGVARAMIEAMNAGPCVYAVDLPSGINGTTGAVMGAAVKADRDGDVLPPQARPSAAARPAPLRRLQVADIGFPRAC